MRVKEILPWTIESPIIHLVQPSPTIPLGHEVVVQQNGSLGNAFYAMAAQNKNRKHRRAGQEGREFVEKAQSNLNTGYISPGIHQATAEKTKRNSFYDLRSHRSVSLAAEQPRPKCGSARSKSVDVPQSPLVTARKFCPDFEEILRDLRGESRLRSDTCESAGSKGSSHDDRSASRERQNSAAAASDSVFYDVALDLEQPQPEARVEVESRPRAEVRPRKSFSEETFDRNRAGLYRQRTLAVANVVKSRNHSSDSCDEACDAIWNGLDGRRVSQMVDDLLLEIYGDPLPRRRSCVAVLRSHCESGCTSASGSESLRKEGLVDKGVAELRQLRDCVLGEVKRLGGRLAKQLVRRDVLLVRRNWHCDWITAYLQANSQKTSEDTRLRFSVSPSPAAGAGDCGFAQWQSGMRMVARLPEGIPHQFRKTLWLTLAEKHLAGRGVQWQQVEEFCFNEFTNPDDEELGVQIVKDVHRTGCSLFCGVSGKDNQALLKRVLLAYARWNKAVGYCQGFNMLAALILQVMDKSEVDSVKVMIFLIEGVLPESYFANNLRGLSVDMAVFRDLLRLKLPTLSRHFDQLQCDSKDSGTSYEPPLTNVFTMQWFLTLFCNCLPQDTVLRVWDLIFLEGNHILLCTALAIWSTLSDRILSVESADEFYCIMGVLTREMLEFGLMDANALIKAIVSFNLPELGELREKYLYNITPWTQSVSTVARRGLRLFYSDDDTDTDEDDEKIAIATAYGLFRSPKKKDGASGVTSPPRALTCPDKDKIAMDISALTKQYRKLRERQKQAHVILTAACGSQGLVGPTASPAMNHLLMGKFALVNSKGRRLGPPPGAVPPPTFLAKPRVSSPSSERKTRVISGETLHWKDALDQSGQKKDDGDQSPEVDSRASSRRGSVSSSSTSTELCDDPQRMSDSEDLTNSLSEPPDRSQPSTPRIQPKILHSIDLDSCKEDPENKEEEESPNIQCDEVDQLREEIASISSISPGDDERPHRRKPSSFRIDPEELRQLDRKLSLKIVEIERRKSNAGIESEDLNSKVLFPFDRDYLGDGDNPERADSPSSIPDDRLCCMEDFDDECIPVPDLITTHKPINFRMSSLEECDETKLSDVDPHKMSFKEPGDDVDEELESLHESDEMSDEEYEQDECQNSSDYSKFNFDDLFPAKEDESNECYEQHNLADNFQNKTLTDCESDQPCSAISEFDTNTPNINFSTQNDLESHKSHSNDLSLSSRNQNGYETHLFMNIMSCNENKELNNATNAVIISDESSKTNGPTLKSDEIINIRNYELRKSDNEGQEGNLNNDAGSVLDDKKFNESSSLDGSTLHFLSRDKNVENLKTDEEDMTSKLLSYQTLATDSEKSCKVKVKFDIRSSLALSNALPDVTSVSSSDFDIDSIRKKYANFGQLSYERPAFESLDVKTSELNGCKDTTETVVVNKEDNQSLLGTAIRADLKPILDIEQTDVCGTLDHVQSTEGLPVISSEQSITNTRQSSITSDSNNHMDSSVSDVHDREDHTDVIMSDLRLRDVENIPQQSSPSRRRGSEVALNLILKENSQILTKIQQQSRRSSDVWVDSKSMNENETSDILDQLNDLRMGAELRSLNNVILETLEGSGESKLVPSESIIEKKKDIHETDQINCSNTNLNEQKYQNQQDSLVEKHDSKTVNKPCDVDDAESFTKTDKLRKEIKGKTLPDVCKYDYEYIKQSRPGGEYALTATSNKDTQLENNDSKSDITTKTNHDCFTTKLDINTYTPPKTTYSVKKSEKSIKDIENYTDEYNFDKLSSQNSSEPKYLINIQNTPRGIFSPIDDQNEAQDKSGLSSPAIGKTQKASDANEDIIKELRYLDIKPEETLDYSTTKKTPLSTPNLEDHLTSLEKNLSSVTSEDYTPTKGYHGESYTSGNNSKVTVEKFVSLKSHYNGKENSMENMTTDKLDDFILSKKYSLANEDEELAHSSNSGRSRSMLQKNYMHHKSASVDVVSHDKLTTEPDKPKGSFVRSATTVEDDDSMYMNSYKSHGRLLIEKGELKTHRRSDEELRKSTDTFNRSAYDFKKASGSDGINLTYSRFSSETSKLPETSYVRPTEKMLFRYKSEDHGIGTTPLRCRFSSASPIRTRLDSFSADTDFRSSSAVNRTKSPSPTLYRSSPVAERLVSGRLDSSGSDYSHSSKDYPRYSRTESLDSSSSSRPTGHLRRKTESLDSFTEEKKITSPQSPVKFNPFPVRSLSRQPKDLGVKLGLYLPSKADKSPTKRLT